MTKARRAGTGWEAMVVWYNADGSAEPMSDWDDETTSEGVQCSDGTKRAHSGRCSRKTLTFVINYDSTILNT